jgi:type I restriction enzyme M protein
MVVSLQQFEVHIFSALDELRGYLDPHEAVDYLIGLFLLRFLSEKYELKNESSNGEAGHEKQPIDFYVPDEARWNTIRTSSHPGDAISHALHSIRVSGNQKLSDFGLFSSLERLQRNPALCGRLVNRVSALDLSGIQSHELAILTDQLITLSASALGAQGGEFYTSPDLAGLLVSLLGPEPGKSIYDPACGTGSLLISAYNYAQSGTNNNSKTHVYCQEINSRTAALAYINAIIHDVANASFAVSNSLLHPEFGKENGKFDFVVTNPPIGLRLNPDTYQQIRYTRGGDFRFGPPTKVADYNFLQHVISQLNGDGRAVMLMGLRPLFISGIEGQIRRALVQSDVIEAVITLAPNLLPHTSASSAVLILNKNKTEERRNKIQFIFADNEYEPLGRARNSVSLQNRQKILDAYKNLKIQNQFSAVVKLEDVATHDFTLLPARYVGLSDVDISLGSDVRWLALNELATVFKGTSLGRHSGGSVPVIQGRDLSVPYLAIDQLEKKHVPEDLRRAVYLQAGDVLLQRIGQRPQAFLVEEELSGVLVSDTVYVIRFKEDNRPRARYIVEFLNSTPGQAQLASAIAGAVVPTLRLTSLREISVPIPNQAVVELVNNLHEVEHTLFERMNKARQLRQKLFTIENQEQVAEELRNLSIDAQVLSESIIRADDLNFQIRNYYPYVLAYVYRSLDSIQGEAKLYKEQLRLAENLMAFLGSMGLMLTAWVGSLTNDDNGVPRDKLLEYWQKGISPGDWVDIAIRTAKLLRPNEEHAAIVSFSDIWFKGKGSKQSQFRENLQNWVTRKNDFKHDRWPQADDEYAVAVRDIGQEIQQCLQKIAFLVQYPMRLIQDSDVDWRTKKIVASTLVYIGDHPVLRQERISLNSPVSKDKLYLELKGDTLVPLYPLFSVHNCSVCKMREVFMVDRWDGPGDRIVLKSFERGHAHDKEAARKVAEDLEHWLENVYQPRAI